MAIHKTTAVCTVLLMLTTSIFAQDNATKPTKQNGRIAPPDTVAVMNYGLNQFFQVEYGLFREAKDEQTKVEIAKVLYKNFFILWFATENSPEKIADFNLRGYVSYFVNGDKTQSGLLNLVENQDDPMLWNRINRTGVSEEEMDSAVSMLAGFPVLGWVAQETKDPAAYKEAVGKFRAYVTAAKTDGR